MIISTTTIIELNFDIDEYDDLIIECQDYIQNNNNALTETVNIILDDMENNYQKLSNFTIKSHLEIKFAGEFFKDLSDDIEEIDNDEYPLLCNLLITIANSI